MPHAGLGARIVRFGRIVRSGAFFIVYTCYLMTIIGLGQRLIVWPMIVLVPRWRQRIVRGWLRFHARATFAMARLLANVRLSVEGAIAPESCIVVMNHQSVLDIPLGLLLVRGPYPLIPTRDRYKHGLPGISPLGRLAQFPFVSQRRVPSRAELAALNRAAEQVARGERSLLIFPEGHRTRDGNIGPFMRSGLRLLLTRTKRPVYCVVVDGITQSRTFADALVNFAGMNVRATVFGPFPPPDRESIDSFIDTLHERMTAALAQLRTQPSSSPSAPSDQPAAGVADSTPAR
jgi:1-acyl-sn-glycerol-3-phosphate acyltransferase